MGWLKISNILITGGAGFIGSNFVRYYSSEHPKDRLIVFDKLTYAGNIKNIEDVLKGSRNKFILGDICEPKAIFKAVKDADYMINFAAETHVDRSIEKPDNFIKTNIYGTYVLLEAIRKSKIKKFVHVSTDEVYGEIIQGSADENAELNPGNPYAATKAAADMLALSYFRTYKIPVVITRTCNNFGRYQNREKLIPSFVSCILENKKVPLYGNGLNIREWIYVIDNCSAIDTVLTKGTSGEVYNISTGILKKNFEIAKQILKVLKKDDSLISYVEDRPSHDRRYCMDSEKIRKLGWAPRYEFESSLREVIENFRIKQASA